MGRNTGPGGKNRRKGKSMTSTFRRELRLKEDLEEYGIVEKMLGDSRVSVRCNDDTMRVCHIRGKFRKRVWISAGDVVLISLREFQEEKADVIHKYTADEVLILNHQKEINFGAGNEREETTDMGLEGEDVLSEDQLIIDEI